MFLFSLLISEKKKKKKVSLGLSLLRILRIFQKARIRNTSFWQGSAPEVYPLQEDKAEKHFILLKSKFVGLLK